MNWKAGALMILVGVAVATQILGGGALNRILNPTGPTNTVNPSATPGTAQGPSLTTPPGSPTGSLGPLPAVNSQGNP